VVEGRGTAYGRCNVQDVAEWLRFNLNGGVHHDRQLLSPAAIRELQTPHMSMNDPNEPFVQGHQVLRSWGTRRFTHSHVLMVSVLQGDAREA
jgi:hypothetical protein